jgi:hypothetical protein
MSAPPRECEKNRIRASLDEKGPIVAKGQWSRLHRLSQPASADEVAALKRLAPDEIELIPVLAAREASRDAAVQAAAQARLEKEAADAAELPGNDN